MTVVYPMEIIIMPKTTYILTDYTVSRRIFTDGRDWAQGAGPGLQTGLSIGKWVDMGSDGRYSALEAANPRLQRPSHLRRRQRPSSPRRQSDGHQGANIAR